MPPRKILITPVHTSIDVLFKKNKVVVATQSPPCEPLSAPSGTLTSENAEVQAFYDSLSPYQRIAHTIAIEKLGTSYDVLRTHGFLSWNNTRK